MIKVFFFFERLDTNFKGIREKREKEKKSHHNLIEPRMLALTTLLKIERLVTLNATMKARFWKLKRPSNATLIVSGLVTRLHASIIFLIIFNN
jgi:hypothetical protein